MTVKELDSYIIKFLNGDSSSFEYIYLASEKSVYFSIKAIINRQDIIEDLMQDTYIKMIDALPNYKIGTNFLAWISMIARNNAINYYRKNKRIELIDEENSYDIVDDSSSSPLLDKALEILESSEKEIIIYHIVLNYTFKDISKIMDMKLSTVFYYYKEALKKIKKEIPEVL